MKRFGLIGFPVSHSYSKEFFSKKFEELDLKDHRYDLLEMKSIEAFPRLWKDHPELVGLNVTVPHKQAVIPYLDRLDESASKVGATNVIFRKGTDLIGFNTDYFAFKQSLENWIGKVKEALILGTGGASKAVEAALKDLGIPFCQVSRSENADFTYDKIKADPKILSRFDLIINTTPLGMHPNIDSYPDLPYEYLKPESFLYDLVYNPEETAFMKMGSKMNAKTKNGLEMLRLQAEESWKIWNS